MERHYIYLNGKQWDVVNYHPGDVFVLEDCCFCTQGEHSIECHMHRVFRRSGTRIVFGVPPVYEHNYLCTDIWPIVDRIQ